MFKILLIANIPLYKLGEETDIILKKSDSIIDLLLSCNCPFIITHFHAL